MQIDIPATVPSDNPVRKFSGCLLTAIERPDLLFIAEYRYTPYLIRQNAAAELARRAAKRRGSRGVPTFRRSR